MRKDLRAYVRVDASNRVIPGSMVLRKRPPGNRSNGTWVEVLTYVCCAPPGTPGGPQEPVTVAIPAIDPVTQTFSIEISNGGMTTGVVDTATTTAADLVTYLTTNYASEGTYVLDGTNITFTPALAGTTLAITVA